MFTIYTDVKRYPKKSAHTHDILDRPGLGGSTYILCGTVTCQCHQMDSSTYFTVLREAQLLPKANNFIFNLSKTKVSLGMKTGGGGCSVDFIISVSFSNMKFENSGTSSREKKARRKKCKIIAGIAIFLTILL